MKLTFFFYLLLLVPVGLAIALAYVAGRAVWSLISDWRLGRELAAIRRDSQRRRAEREARLAQRLDNGCQHAFGEGLGAFPPAACPKCGLEQTPPPGPCDHVWRRMDGPFPASRCERCGKVYQGLDH